MKIALLPPLAKRSASFFPTTRPAAHDPVNDTTGTRLSQYRKHHLGGHDVLLGETSVGKSSLVDRLVFDRFIDGQSSTSGANFLTKTVQLKNITIKYFIWDTAGQERYNALARIYYRGARAAIVVYDITNSESFRKAQTWIKELENQADSNICIALVGNKLDLVTNQSTRAVSYEEAKQYADEMGLLFMETSAKTSNSIDNVFTNITKEITRNESNLKNERGGLKLKPSLSSSSSSIPLKCSFC